MKYILIGLVAVIFTSASFNTPKSAAEIDKFYSGVLDSLFLKGKDWAMSFALSSPDKNFAALKAPRVEMEKFITRNVNYINSIKNNFGAEAYKNALLNFLTYEQSLIQKGFIPFEKLNKSSTVDDIKKLQAQLNTLAANETKELETLNKLAKDYRVKNKLPERKGPGQK